MSAAERDLIKQYLDFLWREATARVDAGGIPQRWSEPGGREIARAYVKKLSAGLDKLVRGIADDAMRLGDQNSIATHVAMGLEIYPEMRDFLASALRSPRSKYANRPPRQATTARHVSMARYVTLELSCSQKGLTQIYEDIALIFKCGPRTVANAYRTHKKWLEFQNNKLIDWLALQEAVMRAHP